MATSLERSEKKASVQNPERRKTVVCVCVCMWWLKMMMTMVMMVTWS